MTSSPSILYALETWREIRAEYEAYLDATYLRAETETGGALLNARGREANIDARSLLMGNEARAMAYASDELKEWWRSNPRVNFARFEEERTPYPSHQW